VMCIYCFFFSSRRRHTRCYRDWSSDVCSSDLSRFVYGKLVGSGERAVSQGQRARMTFERHTAQAEHLLQLLGGHLEGTRRRAVEIGRASCRERVQGAGVGDCCKKEEKE